jgi:hypothetical protein
MAFLAYRSHPETHYHLLSGCREDALRKVNGAWTVARRTIVLHAHVLLDKTSASSSMGQNLFSVLPLTAKRGSRKSITTAGKCPIPAVRNTRRGL